MRVCVTGGNGFIGHHLVRRLQADSHPANVKSVDIEPGFAVDNWMYNDMRIDDYARNAIRSTGRVFALAADKGGAGYISWAHAPIIQNNTLIDANTFWAAKEQGIERLVYTSTVCVYPTYRLDTPYATPLDTANVYPAMPEGAYGWEKLHAEHILKYYREAGWLDGRVARLHNVYGKSDHWRGGREKSVAALCRKVAVAKLTGQHTIEVWGDGRQVRTFMYIDDCVEGLCRIMDVPKDAYTGPITLGVEDHITIDGLVGLIAEAANADIAIVHIDGPQGVRGRCADNTLLRKVLGWEPKTLIREGVPKVYAWVEAQVRAALERGETL